MANVTSNQMYVLAIGAGIGLAVLLVGYTIMTQPDQRSPMQHVGDAARALPDGIAKAARELQPRTPAEKMKDAAEDVKDDAQHALERQ